MPYLATTRAGVSAFLNDAPSGTALWLGANVISESEVNTLRLQGRSVSVFTHAVLSFEQIEAASSTVREHHPTEALWVEPAPELVNPRSVDVGQAFLWHEPIVGVEFEHNALVEVTAGRYAGQCGSLVTILSLSPETVFVVELESGHDAEVKQSELRSAGV